ncbi:MAG: diguanylate cyclase [Cyanobacteria bacterium J06649_4]
MNSVLLIGHQSFANAVRSQVRGLNSLTVTLATTVGAAKNCLSSDTPDVVIAQSDLLSDKSISKTFGTGHSPYFIVIEIAQRPQESPESICAQQLEKTALALESGADAFLWLPPKGQTVYQSDRLPLQFSPRVDAGRVTSTGDFEDEAYAPSTVQTTLFNQPAKSTAIAFQENQCRLIQAHIQLGLSQAQRYRDLSRINDWLSAVALVDALTQINNRRAFDLELPNQIKMARAKGTALSLMVLDIDYFKSVNDRFGHLIGDDMLKQLSHRLLTNMRFYDTPFRYGGEEFIVTLNNTDLEEGIAIANRLRESIGSEPFRLPQPVDDIKSLEITVSIGITELLPEDDEQGSSFLNRADQNLLRAKEAGRNRVVGALNV